MTIEHAQPTDIDSRKAAWRLLTALLLMLLGNSGMYAVSVVLPTVQTEFGISRADASLPYTLCMLGFGLGGMCRRMQDMPTMNYVTVLRRPGLLVRYHQCHFCSHLCVVPHACRPRGCGCISPIKAMPDSYHLSNTVMMDLCSRCPITLLNAVLRT